MSDVTPQFEYLDKVGVAEFKRKLDEQLTLIDGGKLYMEDYTFLSSGWDSGGQYSLEEDYPSSYYDIIGITSSNDNTTDAMLEAWLAAGIYGYEEYNMVTAHEETPSINITMTLIVRRKSEYEGGYSYAASQFSASSIYDVDALVLHDGQVFKCVSPIETAGPWDPSDWELTTLGDEISAGGGGGDIGLSVVDGAICVTYEDGEDGGDD